MVLSSAQDLAADMRAFDPRSPVENQQGPDPVLPGQVRRPLPVEISSKDLLDERVRGNFFSDVSLFRHDVTGELGDWFPFTCHGFIVANSAFRATGASREGEGVWL